MNRRLFLASLGGGAAAGIGGGAPAQTGKRPTFHLGSVTYNVLKDHNLDDVLRILETTGFEGVELRTGHKHGVEPSLPAAERTRVRRRFEKTNVRLVAYGTVCEFHSPDAQERQKQVRIAKEFIDLAHDTGALGVKVRPNGLPAEAPKETTIANIGAALRELGEYGSGKRVGVWLEVHGSQTSPPPIAAAIMKAATHENAALCWNSNNVDIVNGSVEQSFNLLKQWIRHVHIHELGKDGYPYAELFALLNKAGYTGYTMAEIGAGAPNAEDFFRTYRARWLELVGTKST
ncbi:MAG: sugar phosphate isomerase/epimerase family protein [Bryobacteraceae bacterium]